MEQDIQTLKDLQLYLLYEYLQKKYNNSPMVLFHNSLDERMRLAESDSQGLEHIAWCKVMLRPRNKELIQSVGFIVERPIDTRIFNFRPVHLAVICITLHCSLSVQGVIPRRRS